MLNIALDGDRELIARFENAPGAVILELKRTSNELAIELRDHVRDDKLSGQVLKIRSGDLKASIQEIVSSTPSSVEGKVYSSGDIKYARIWEITGSAAHEVEPVKAKALSFLTDGKRIFAKRVHVPAQEPRPFLKPALADMREQIVSELNAAARRGTRR